MRHFRIGLIELFASLGRNKGLVKTMIEREVVGRYRGSVAGILWSFLNPLFMLLIYTFVFSEIFKARWNGGGDSKADFALVLFAGLIVYNLFAECVTKAPGLILSHVNFVKKVVFPLEILPWVILGSALFHAGISILVWLGAYTVLFGTPYATVLYLPLVVLPLVFLILGISWLLASLGVFLRDVTQFVGIVTTALLFLSPVFYPATVLPEHYRVYIYLNPLTPVIEQMRDVLYWGHEPDFALLGYYFVATLGVAWFGFAWFQKTRKGFADVL